MDMLELPQNRIAKMDVATFHGVAIDPEQAKKSVDVLRRETHIPEHWLEILEEHWARVRDMDIETLLQMNNVIEAAFWELGLQTHDDDDMTLCDVVSWRQHDKGDYMHLPESDNELLAHIAEAMGKTAAVIVVKIGK